MNIGSLPPNNKLVLAALAGSILLASLGISITTVALPTLATAFSATVQQVQWVVLAYLLSLTVFYRLRWAHGRSVWKSQCADLRSGALQPGFDRLCRGAEPRLADQVMVVAMVWFVTPAAQRVLRAMSAKRRVGLAAPTAQGFQVQPSRCRGPRGRGLLCLSPA